MSETSLVIEEEQDRLEKEVSVYEQRARDIAVRNDEDFAFAGELVKQVKSLQKKAEEYWEPMRVNAYNTYQAVLNRKKEMVDPMKNAEKIIKAKMTEYSKEKERQRQEKERELRRLADKEAKKKLQEAMEAEQKGDESAADYALAEAEVMEEQANTAKVEQTKVKVNGISESKTWVITGIDPEEVPVKFEGIEIRPVDEKAVLRIIKDKKGNVSIPGVKFEESVTYSVRS